MILSEGVPVEDAGDLFAMLVMGGIALLLGWVAAIFIVSFYLLLFGMPVALLLGDRIRHPLALGVALIDAAISAALVVSGSALDLLEGGAFHVRTFAIVLCFALPAGYLYRRSVIAFRDEAELAP